MRGAPAFGIGAGGSSTLLRTGIAAGCGCAGAAAAWAARLMTIGWPRGASAGGTDAISAGGSGGASSGAAGFQTPEGNATEVRAYDDDRILFNMSVWASLEDLSRYVYAMESEHRHVMKQRRSWFERFEGPYMALWWIPEGHIPTIDEAKARLESLRLHGATPFAFTFKRPFPAPDAQEEEVLPPFEECPA